MSPIWIAVIGASVTAFLNKYIGHSVPEKWLDRPKVKQINTLVPIVLLSALVGVQTFADKKEAAELQVALNRCIREGREVVPETFNNSRLISYWFLIKSIKDDMLFLMRNNGPSAYIGDRQCGGEGYVKINNHGMFKLVNREQFSHANFNNGRFANVN